MKRIRQDLRTAHSFTSHCLKARTSYEIDDETRDVWLLVAIMVETMSYIAFRVTGDEAQTFLDYSIPSSNGDWCFVQGTGVCLPECQRAQLTTVCETYVSVLRSQTSDDRQSSCTTYECHEEAVVLEKVSTGSRSFLLSPIHFRNSVK